MTVKGSPFIMDNTLPHTDQYSTIGSDYRVYLKDKIFSLEQTAAKMKHEIYAKDEVIEQLKSELAAERHVSAQLEAHIIEFKSKF